MQTLGLLDVHQNNVLNLESCSKLKGSSLPQDEYGPAREFAVYEKPKEGDPALSPQTLLPDLEMKEVWFPTEALTCVDISRRPLFDSKTAECKMPTRGSGPQN